MESKLYDTTQDVVQSAANAMLKKINTKLWDPTLT